MFEKIKRLNHLKTVLNEKVKTEYIKQINQGFYGYVYLIKTTSGKKFIAKIYKNDGFAQREQAQLEMLRKHALAHVPEVMGIGLKKQNGYFDVLFMEYIDGITAFDVKITDKYEKLKLSDEIVDNLIAIHSISNEKGFGDFITDDYSKSWEQYYNRQICGLYNELIKNKPLRLSHKNLETAKTLLECFDKIFCPPVKTNSLIHGDYNMWNLMVNPQTNRLCGILDPFGCSFADRELDLFQLQNANGNEYGLLENYASKIILSDNFELKNNYYRFWDDIKHLVYAGYCSNKLFSEYSAKVLNLLD